MKNHKTEIKLLRDLSARLCSGKPEDFDGRTEFYRLTPEQRLEWFEQDDDIPFMMQVFQILLKNARSCLLSVMWTALAVCKRSMPKRILFIINFIN